MLRAKASLKLSGAISLVILCSTALFLCAQTHVPTKPFSKDETIRLLKGDVSPKRIEVLVRERGIDFEVNQEAEKDLRQAGATNGLLATLKELTPKPTTPTPTSPTSVPSRALDVLSDPGGAKVYIDDAPVGTTSRQGLLKLPNLPVGKHRVRVSLDAYEDCERDIELTHSLLTNMYVVLAAKGINASGACLDESSLIARNRKELEILKLRRGRNIFEFTLQTSKTPQTVGPIQLLLNYASQENQRYSVTVLVDDRSIEKKDRSPGEPLQIYVRGFPVTAPYEIVIFAVGEGMVSGYLATPRYASH
jgi:hypothetical protein